tara:strand:- start:251 stop:1030 length:780 start_codon:yes stop_codon:yes gene_type:complete
MKNETKVGLLFLFTSILVVCFVYLLGSFDLFSKSKEIHLLYNFAGGIEVGSPVRAMGIKVGRVENIRFDADQKDARGEEVKLILTVSIHERAWDTIREDSRFFINLAGVIGEKYIEISPGSSTAKHLQDGGYYRGIDPPRIDQLISQSYSLAGKILELVENNEGDVVSIIQNIDRLVVNVNKALSLVTNSKAKSEDFADLIGNMAQISGDVASISGGLRSKEAKETVHLLYRLMWRLEDLDKEAIKKFFQEDGIKAKLF